MIYPRLESAVQKLWARKSYALWPLVPLSWVFTGVASLRRALYQQGFLKQSMVDTPVIVVGNLSLGGSGKTPLVLYLAKMLQDRGLTVGVISRGYKGQHQQATFVMAQSDPAVVGDEPLMMYRRVGCTVVVAKDRVAALKALLAHEKVDVVLSDDGLQHYALGRAIEIAVINPDQRLRVANGYCLPAGPLREPLSRLQTVDVVVENAMATLSVGVGIEAGPVPCLDPAALEIHYDNTRCFQMYYQAELLYKAQDPTHRQALEAFKGTTVHAVAGLGHPERFFAQLESAGLSVIPHPYPDHHAYQAQDLVFDDLHPVILTEKDFVKCRGFVQAGYWVLPIHACLSPGFDAKIMTLLKGDQHG